jgi:hypothetical protein
VSIGDVRFLGRFDTQTGNLFHYVRYDCVPNIYAHTVITPKSRHPLAQIWRVCSPIVWLSESTALRLASKVVMRHPAQYYRQKKYCRSNHRKINSRQHNDRVCGFLGSDSGFQLSIHQTTAEPQHSGRGEHLSRWSFGAPFSN